MEELLNKALTLALELVRILYKRRVATGYSITTLRIESEEIKVELNKVLDELEIKHV